MAERAANGIGRRTARFAFPRLARRVDVLLALTRSDLRARYGRGPWQPLKWLIDPFALVGVYLLLVGFLVDRPGRAIGLSLARAIVPFQLVMMTVTNAMTAITARGSIVLNMSFDRMLIPVAAALTETVAFVASFGLLALMMVVYGVAPTAAIVAFPLVVAVTVFFALACSYGASLFAVWLPDLRPFAISFVRTLFFLAPGLVALPVVAAGHDHALLGRICDRALLLRDGEVVGDGAFNEARAAYAG